MLSVAICDDDIQELDTIFRAVRSELPDGADIQTFFSARELLDSTAQGWIPNLAILDIQLDQVSGIQLGKKLNLLFPDCQIVFITNYLNYAPDVYDVRHSYFILKQQLENRIRNALTRAQQDLANQPQIFFRNGNQLYSKNSKDIWYLERRLHKTYLFCNSGSYETAEHAVDILSRANIPYFCRCHQSYWVNLSRVASMNTSHFLMDNGSIVPISRNYHKEAKRQFFSFLHSGLNTSTHLGPEQEDIADFHGASGMNTR